jgi:hypothetical protein
MNHTTAITKDECLKRFNAAFDIVLDNKRLSIHVRAHLMEALSGIQRGVKGWRKDAHRVRTEFIRLKEFVLTHVPEDCLPMIYERIEAAGDACRELLGEEDAVECEQRKKPRFKVSF